MLANLTRAPWFVRFGDHVVNVATVWRVNLDAQTLGGKESCVRVHCERGDIDLTGDAAKEARLFFADQVKESRPDAR